MSASGLTLYIGGGGVLAERFAGSSTVQWTNYLFAAGQMVGVFVERSDETVATRYFHLDHLGSVSVISDENGIVVERLSYDAWGLRRHPDGTPDPAGAITSQSTRGFTGHEHLAEVGLIHMNGRVYDPLLARFGTPDPMTENPFSTQGWNRYSYVGNSPVNFTDPSGYCFMGCFWKPIFKAIQRAFQKIPILGAIIRIAATAICAVTPGCQPFLPMVAGFASAAVAGITSGNLGVALRAGLTAFATAVAFNAVGDITPSGSFGNIAGHALVGCASAVAEGGKCGPGALSAGVTAFAGPVINGRGFSVQSLVANAVLGGVASVAGGGKFANGAVTSAFGYLFNSAMHDGDAGRKEPAGVQEAYCPHPACVAAKVASDALTIGVGLLALTKGAPESGYAIIWQSDNHVSIEVFAGGQSLRTEQFGGPGDETLIQITNDAGVRSAQIPLPNARGALEFSRGLVGQSYGMHDLTTRSCLTYCGDVLRAGGLSVPQTTRSLMRHLQPYKR